MNRLSESDIIKIFQNRIGKKRFSSEDVETFSIGKTNIVINIDTLVESTDIPPRTKISDAARKSIVAAISDFAAKGVKPRYGVISVTLSQNFSKSKLEELSKAIGSASKEFNISILGGDTNEGKELVIHVCLLGFSNKIVPRKGAKQGDLIFVTGPFGYTTAGLKILLDKKKADSNFSKKAISSVIRPKTRLKFALKAAKYFSASMDSSDGLSTAINELARQSKNRFVLTKIPCNKELMEFAKHNKLNHYELVFNGGEEYEIVFTASPKKRTKLTNLAKKQKIPLKEIGYVSKGRGAVFLKNGKTLKIKDSGWHHFGR